MQINDILQTSITQKRNKLTLSKESLANLTLYMVFIFLGLGLHVIYVFFTLLYILQKPNILINIKIKTNFLIVLLLISIFLIPQYTIGYDYTTFDNPYLSMFSVYFSLLIIGYIFQLQDFEKQKYLISIILIGIGLEAIIAVSYSFLIDPFKYGYGLMYNPFLNEETNSPALANKLALLSTLCIFYFINSKSKIMKLLTFITIVVATIMSMWLASRAYFVLFFLSLFIVLMLNFRIKTIGYYFVFCILLFVVYLLVSSSIDLSIFSKLDRLSGSLESARFGLYADGWNKLLQNPFGGFTVNQQIDTVRWFHNIFLDAGRLAGWLPIIGLISFIIFTYYKYLVKKNKLKFQLPILVFTLVLILSQQDVVLEGMVRFILMIYFCSIVVTRKFIDDC